MPRKRKNKISKVKIFTFVLTLTGIAVTAAANSSAFSGLQASSVEAKINKLTQENQQLEIQAARLKSLQSLTSSAYAKEEMVEVKDLKHVSQNKEAAESERASLTVNP